MSFKRDPMSCPHCGHLNDQHTAISNPPSVPHDGDFSMCIQCGQWAVFAPDGYRLPTMAEWGILIRDPDCLRAERAWRAMRKQMGQ